MITDIKDLENMLAQMVAEKHPERLEKLGITTEYIADMLRPFVIMLRNDAIATAEGAISKAREAQDERDKYKDENYRLKLEVRKLRKRVDELEGNPTDAKPQATSENSSLPPSKDPIGFKRTASLRQKSGKPSGGQKGHKGSTLEQTPTPNKTIECAPAVCPCCGKPIRLDSLRIAGKRQVIDLPLPIVPIITEYLKMAGECECGCHIEGEYPAEASSPVSYGPNVEALVGFLSSLHSIPFKRLTDILNCIFGLGMSQGTVSNILNRMRKKCEARMDGLRSQVEQSEVVGADETGCKINGDSNWIWTFQTDLITYMFSDKSRGKAAIDKHFPYGLPNSIVVSDRHSPYFKMEAKDHQICLPHLIRNLTYLSLIAPQSDWPTRMMEFLRESIHLRHTVTGNIDKLTIKDMTEKLNGLMDEHPMTEDPKQQEHLDNFIANLMPKKGYMLTFLANPNVPSDNNASERSVRPVKTKMKVSGQFKSDDGAGEYTTLHSIIQTARKQGRDPYQALVEVAKL